MRKISFAEANSEKYYDFKRMFHYHIVERAELINIYTFQKKYYLVAIFFQKEKNPRKKMYRYFCENDEDLIRCLRKMHNQNTVEDILKKLNES